MTLGRHTGLTILNAVPQLPLRRAESGLRVQGVHDHRPGRGHRRDPGLGHPGCGGSMPYKEVCLEFVDAMDASAEASGR